MFKNGKDHMWYEYSYADKYNKSDCDMIKVLAKSDSDNDPELMGVFFGTQAEDVQCILENLFTEHNSLIKKIKVLENDSKNNFRKGLFVGLILVGVSCLTGSIIGNVVKKYR